MEQRKRDTNDLYCELAGISAQLTALSIQFDDGEERTLTDQAIKDYLYSIAQHIDRIAENLEEVSA